VILTWAGRSDDWTAARMVVDTVAALPDAGLPGWAMLVLSIVGVVTGFMLALVRRLVPQESGDRLRWWIALLAHRRRMAADSKRQEPVQRIDRHRPSNGSN
jgi:hypothetical protein